MTRSNQSLIGRADMQPFRRWRLLVVLTLFEFKQSLDVGGIYIS